MWVHTRGRRLFASDDKYCHYNIPNVYYIIVYRRIAFVYNCIIWCLISRGSYVFFKRIVAGKRTFYTTNLISLSLRRNIIIKKKRFLMKLFMINHQKRIICYYFYVSLISYYLQVQRIIIIIIFLIIVVTKSTFGFSVLNIMIYKYDVPRYDIVYYCVV